jgi:hypothetical protein
VGSFPQVSPPNLSILLCSPPFALHAPPISFISILSPVQFTLGATVRNLVATATRMCTPSVCYLKSRTNVNILIFVPTTLRHNTAATLASSIPRTPLQRTYLRFTPHVILQSHPGLLLPQTQCLISTLYSPPNYKCLKQTFLRVLEFDLSSHSCVLFWMGANTFSHTKESTQRSFPREVAEYVHTHFWSTAKNSKYPSKYRGGFCPETGSMI